MSDIKINVKVDNKENTVSLSAELEFKAPVWSKRYTKFLPNKEYKRFHWVDAKSHLVSEGYDIERQPSSGPVKITNNTEEGRTGTWTFNLKQKPTPRPKATVAKKTKTKKKEV